nr:hypothetical protein GCM10025732_00460 [Glycomyces mayteni]
MEEEAVDALEGDAGGGADGVHPDGLHASGVEEPVGGVDHLCPGRGVVDHMGTPCDENDRSLE